MSQVVRDTHCHPPALLRSFDVWKQEFYQVISRYMFHTSELIARVNLRSTRLRPNPDFVTRSTFLSPCHVLTPGASMVNITRRISHAAQIEVLHNLVTVLPADKPLFRIRDSPIARSCVKITLMRRPDPFQQTRQALFKIHPIHLCEIHLRLSQSRIGISARHCFHWGIRCFISPATSLIHSLRSSSPPICTRQSTLAYSGNRGSGKISKRSRIMASLPVIS